MFVESFGLRNFCAAWNRELLHACKYIDSVLGMTMAAWGYIIPLTHGDMYRGGATGESGRFANVSCVFSCSNRMALWLKKTCQGTNENASACAMCVRGCNALIGSVSWTCGGT